MNGWMEGWVDGCMDACIGGLHATSFRWSGVITRAPKSLFLGSKITAAGDCSHEIKRRLLLERKVLTNLDSILNEVDETGGYYTE